MWKGGVECGGDVECGREELSVEREVECRI